jgi:DNA-binding IclR family transcriptional regulator
MKVNLVTQHPALLRGLDLFAHIALRPQGVSFSDLKKKFSISDTSLTRLLKSLTHSQWLTMAKRGLYTPGPRAMELIDGLHQPIDHSTMGDATKLLAQRGQHSSAWVGLEEQSMTFLATTNFTDSVVVAKSGSTLYPEHDHAGALAILAQCDDQTIERLLGSSGSSISDQAQLLDALKTSQKGKGYVDISGQRPGISRIAIGFKWKGCPSALLFCGPSVTLRQNHQRLMTVIEGVIEEVIL